MEPATVHRKAILAQRPRDLMAKLQHFSCPPSEGPAFTDTVLPRCSHVSCLGQSRGGVVSPASRPGPVAQDVHRHAPKKPNDVPPGGADEQSPLLCAPDIGHAVKELRGMSVCHGSRTQLD